MAERKPVVLVGGQLKELPAGDTLPPQTPSAHVHTTSDVTGLGAALAGKEPTISAGTTAQYWSGDKSWQPLNKSAVGLGNVDNTSDANKPISTAQQAALNAKQDALVSGTNIKTVGGQSLLGTGNVQLGDFLYGTPDPDNGGGSDGDVYIQSDGKLWNKGSGVWTYTGIQFTADSVTLTDAAATATLPDTAAASVASRLQALRNNVKQAFADLANKQATLVSGTNIKTVGSKSIVGGGDAGVTAADVGALPADGLLVPAGTANTLNLAAANKAVPITANTSIPTNASVAYDIGTCIILECDGTARTITGPAASSLTLDGNSGTVTSFVLKAYTSVAIRKTDTNAWRVYGDA